MLIVKKTLPTASQATRSVNGPTESGATGHGATPGERPSVSWLVKPCRERTTPNHHARDPCYGDFALPYTSPRIEFAPRLGWPRLHRAAHATRSPGARLSRTSLGEHRRSHGKTRQHCSRRDQ